MSCLQHGTLRNYNMKYPADDVRVSMNRIGNIFIALFRAPSIKNSSNNWANRLFIVYMNHKSI